MLSSTLNHNLQLCDSSSVNYFRLKTQNVRLIWPDYYSFAVLFCCLTMNGISWHQTMKRILLQVLFFTASKDSLKQNCSPVLPPHPAAAATESSFTGLSRSLLVRSSIFSWMILLFKGGKYTSWSLVWGRVCKSAGVKNYVYYDLANFWINCSYHFSDYIL